MNETLEFVLNKFGLNIDKSRNIEIPNVNRINLAQLFGELGFKVGAEIGVEVGKYSKTLFDSIPGLKLYMVDPWKEYKGYKEFGNQDNFDSMYNYAMLRTADYKDKRRIIRKFSHEAVKDFTDGCLDFVYIDANHSLPWIMDDLCAWSRAVRVGGIVSGHDYMTSMRNTKIQVYDAVNCYVTAFRIKPLFLFGSNKIRPNEIREHSRSWMFVKEAMDD